jgi:hypothetical protein
MTLVELMCEAESRRDKVPGKDYAGKLTRGDVMDLIDDLDLSEEEWRAKNG